MKIYVWPDGSWVEASEYCDVADAWRGDDHYTLDVPDSVLYEDIDAYIAEHEQGRELPCCADCACIEPIQPCEACDNK